MCLCPERVLCVVCFIHIPTPLRSYGHSMLKEHQGITCAMMTAAPSFTAASTSSRVLT